MSIPEPPETLPEPIPPLAPPDRLSLRSAFLTGLAALLPTALTAVILVWVFGFLYNHVADPINNFIIFIIDQVAEGDKNVAAAIFKHSAAVEGGPRLGVFDFSFAGFVIALAIVFIVGAILFTFFGRRLHRAVDRALSRMPILRLIYPHLKQLTEFVFTSDKKASFRRVVMIEYPRKGVWSLGFVTASSMADLRNATAQDLVSVFVPSSPTPFTGYVIAVPTDQLVDIPITVDEALRFVVSGGVLVPRSQRQARSDPQTGPETPVPREPGHETAEH